MQGDHVGVLAHLKNIHFRLDSIDRELEVVFSGIMEARGLAPSIRGIGTYILHVLHCVPCIAVLEGLFHHLHREFGFCRSVNASVDCGEAASTEDVGGHLVYRVKGRAGIA